MAPSCLDNLSYDEDSEFGNNENLEQVAKPRFHLSPKCLKRMAKKSLKRLIEWLLEVENYGKNENKQERKIQGEKVKQNVATYNGTEILQDIMQQMYDNNDTTGRATSLKYDNTMPKAWWKAWRKVQRQKECTHQEQGLAAAAEVAESATAESSSATKKTEFDCF